MSDFTLYLDSVAFQEFEIPDSIKAGGAQALFKHKYPGGVRTIDTMGPDDDDITWSGVFMDGAAQDRCRQLDTMRRQGQPVVVTWASYQYLVVIADFKFDFRRFWEIPYSITLAVIQDETYPFQSASQDIDSQTVSDASSAVDDAGVIAYAVQTPDVQSTSLDSSADTSSSDGGLSGLVTSVASGITSAGQATVSTASSALSSAVSSVTSALSSVTSISNATVSAQAGFGSQVASALDASQSLQSTLDTTMDAVGDPAVFASGTSPTLMVASMQNLVNTSTALAATVSVSNTLGRMSINIGQLGK